MNKREHSVRACGYPQFGFWIVIQNYSTIVAIRFPHPHNVLISQLLCGMGKV
jgi:hypothetical protein